MAVTAIVTTEANRQIPPMTSYVDNRVLAANVAETVTVPAGACRVVFGTSALPFYVRTGGAATVPAADITDGTGMAISPADRLVTGGATFSVIAPATTILSFEWFITADQALRSA